MAFPANLTNAVDGVTDVVADHLNNLEGKVGIDGSLVTTSLDYLLKNSASVDPGHVHTRSSLSGLLESDISGLVDDLAAKLPGATYQSPASVNPGHRHVNLYNSNGSAVALTVDANGNIGVGTTSPGALLDVNGKLQSLNLGFPSTMITAVPTSLCRSFFPYLTSSFADMFAFKQVTSLEYDTTGNGNWASGVASDAQNLFDFSQSTNFNFNTASYKGFRVVVNAGTYLAAGLLVIEEMWTTPSTLPFNLKVETSSDLTNWTIVKDTTLITPDSGGSDNNYYITVAEHSTRNYWRLTLVRPDTTINNFAIYNIQLLSNANMSRGYLRGLPITTRYDKTVDFAGGLTSQGSIGVGTTSPNTAALLQLSSTTKGFLPPVMTTAQKTAIGSPPAGLVVYDSTLNKLCVYTGAAWQTLTSA